MRHQHIRRAVAAALLAAVLAVSAPAPAAGWATWRATPSWISKALEWMAGLWVDAGVVEGRGRDVEKTGSGADPDGKTPPPPVPPTTNSDYGPGADPNG